MGCTISRVARQDTVLDQNTTQPDRQPTASAAHPTSRDHASARFEGLQRSGTTRPTPRTFASVSASAAASPTAVRRSFSSSSMHSDVSDDASHDSDVMPYENIANPIFPHSQAFLKVAPACRGSNRNNTFVEGPDGKIRRFPVDEGSSDLIESEPDRPLETIGRTFRKQIAFIYDAPRAAIHETLAEYAIDPEAGTMVFKVGGEAVQSINGRFGVYPLPDGKWMVPQIEFRGCTHACEEMLLAEGKPAAQVQKQMKDFGGLGETTGRPSLTARSSATRRNQEEQISSLKKRAGRTPIVVTGKEIGSTASIGKLKTALAENGPCILGMHGHVRILDQIEESAEGTVFTLRDPFSASFLKVKEHDAFWRSPEAPSSNTAGAATTCSWDAIFLPR